MKKKLFILKFNFFILFDNSLKIKNFEVFIKKYCSSLKAFVSKRIVGEFSHIAFSNAIVIWSFESIERLIKLGI